MNSDPDAALLVAEDIHVMISTADGAKLRSRLLLQLTFDVGGKRFPRGVLEQRLGARRIAGGVRLAHPEGNLLLNLRRYLLEILARVVVDHAVGHDRGVAAGDVEPDTDDRDFVSVCSDEIG